MKYIVFERRLAGATQYMPVIFPDIVTHDSVQITNAIPVSAGFVDIIHVTSSYKQANCHGYSKSLNLSCNAMLDNMIVGRLLNNVDSTNAYLIYD